MGVTPISEIHQCWKEYLLLTTELRVEFSNLERRPTMLSGFQLSRSFLEIDSTVYSQFIQNLRRYFARTSSSTEIQQVLTDSMSRVILFWPMCTRTQDDILTHIPIFEIDITEICHKPINDIVGFIESYSTAPKACYTQNFKHLLTEHGIPEWKHETLCQNFFELFKQSLKTEAFSTEIGRFTLLSKLTSTFTPKTVTLTNQVGITVRKVTDVLAGQIEQLVPEILDSRVQRKLQLSELSTAFISQRVEHLPNSPSFVYGYLQTFLPSAEQLSVFQQVEHSSLVVLDRTSAASSQTTLQNLLGSTLSYHAYRLLQLDSTPIFDLVVSSREENARLRSSWDSLLHSYGMPYPILLSDVPEEALQQVQEAIDWLIQKRDSLDIQRIEQTTVTLQKTLLDTYEQLCPSIEQFSEKVQAGQKQLQLLEGRLSELEQTIKELEIRQRQLTERVSEFDSESQFTQLFLTIRSQMAEIYSHRNVFWAKLLPSVAVKREIQLLSKFKETSLKLTRFMIPLSVYSSFESLEAYWTSLTQLSKVYRKLREVQSEIREYKYTADLEKQKLQRFSLKLRSVKSSQESLLKIDSFFDPSKVQFHQQFFELSLSRLHFETLRNLEECVSHLTAFYRLLQAQMVTSNEFDGELSMFRVKAPEILSSVSLFFVGVQQTLTEPLPKYLETLSYPCYYRALLTNAERMSVLQQYYFIRKAHRSVCITETHGFGHLETSTDALARIQQLSRSSLDVIRQYYPGVQSSTLYLKNFRKQCKQPRIVLELTTEYAQRILQLNSLFTQQMTRTLNQTHVNAKLSWKKTSTSELDHFCAELQQSSEQFDLTTTQLVVLSERRKLQLREYFPSRIRTATSLFFEELQPTENAILLFEPISTFSNEFSTLKENWLFGRMFLTATQNLHVIFLDWDKSFSKTVWENLAESELCNLGVETPVLSTVFQNWSDK